MKTNIIKFSAFTAMLAMVACTNDAIEPPVSNELNLGKGEDVIRISLSDASGTRAERPILSSVATNNINRITFKFLEGGITDDTNVQLVGVINQDGEDQTGAGYVANNNTLELPGNYTGQEILVKFTGLKAKSNYKIIAYGYNYDADVDGAEGDKFPYDIQLVQKGNDQNNYLYEVTGVTAVQEIFAGCNEGKFIGVNQHEKFTTEPVITLNRQVAALIAYFSDAPAYVDNQKVAKITVSAKADVKGFYFPASMLDAPLFNGYDSGDWTIETPNEFVDYLTFDMSNADDYTGNFTSGETYKFESQPNGYLLADGMPDMDDLVCESNTLYGSRFLLAFPSTFDLGGVSPTVATLNICYWAQDGSLIHYVPLKDKDTESYQYGIKCNYLYSIGTKTDSDGTDGDDPISIDEPTGYDYAKVSINNSWNEEIGLIK